MARLSIQSRHAAEEHGWAIEVEGGRVCASRRRRASATGTQIEVRDLFFATPARLKFLRSERAEAGAVTEVVRRLALAHPEVRFTLAGADRIAGRFRCRDPATAALAERLCAGDRPRLRRQRHARSRREREGVRLSGFAGLPTFNRANSLQQFLFVNGRPLRDPLLAGALRAAYADVLARDRYPVAALFLDAAGGARWT